MTNNNERLIAGINCRVSKSFISAAMSVLFCCRCVFPSEDTDEVLYMGTGKKHDLLSGCVYSNKYNHILLSEGGICGIRYIQAHYNHSCIRLLSNRLV